MIVYTIQPEFIFENFKKTGLLKAHDNLICDDSFIDSYSWLENKMSLPPIDIKHPVWAWFRYNGKNKPDLRKSGYLNKSEIGYLIELEIPDEEILLTDFNNWHLILNGSEQDFKIKACIFDKIENIINQDDYYLLLNEGFQEIDGEMIYNWNNIILNKDSLLPYIQATFWSANFNQVKSFKKFKSR